MIMAKPIEVGCSECKAPAGKLCQFANGRERKSFHGARKVAAKKAGKLLPPCRECGATGLQQCRFANGKPRKSPHPSRKMAAKAQGQAPDFSKAYDFDGTRDHVVVNHPEKSFPGVVDEVRIHNAAARKGGGTLSLQVRRQQEAYAKVGLKWGKAEIRENAERWLRRRSGRRSTPAEQG